MEVIVRGHNVKVTEGLSEFTQKKLGKLDRYLPNITEVRVDLSRQHTRRGGDLTIAQITLIHDRGAILRAEEKLRGDDRDALQSAINVASEKMHRQVERFKGKKRSKKRRGRERFFATDEELSVAEDIPVADAVIEEPEEDEIDEGIMRRKIVALHPMNEAEAIEQLELLDHSFFMFLNAESGSVNVLYRREVGGYGILVPE